MKAGLDRLCTRQFSHDAVVLSKRCAPLCRWRLTAARNRRGVRSALWRYEVSAVLAKSQKDGILIALKADEFLANLNKLNITVDPDSSNRIQYLTRRDMGVTAQHRMTHQFSLHEYWK